MPTLPTITARPEKDIDSIRSRWNVANLPLVYNITNTKWPVNSEDATMAITSISDSGAFPGFAQINLVNIDILNKDWIIITGTTNYNGTHQVIGALFNFVVIDFPFGANETGTAQRYYQNYTTVIQINAGIAPTHEFTASDPISLIGTIEQRPDTNNITLADVRDYVKNKINTNYDESQSAWPNDLNGWADFYIAFAERYDDSDGTDVTNFTSVFTDDTDVDGIIYLHAVHGALQFGNSRGGNMFDYVIFDTSGAYFDGNALFMTFFERLKIIDYNNFNISIIIDSNAEYPNLRIIRLEITEFDINNTQLKITISPIPRQDYGLYRIDLDDIVFNDSTSYITIVLLDNGVSELSETKTIDIDVDCADASDIPPPIPAPGTLSAVSDGFDIDLSWTNTNTAKTIKIFRSQTSGSGFVLIDTIGSGSEVYTDTGADSGVYFYKIQYTDSDLESNEANAVAISGVCFVDVTNDDLRTYHFDNTDWVQVGNDLNIAAVINPALAGLSQTRVAFIDNDQDDLRTYAFDGTDWAQVGNDLNFTTGSPAIAAMSSLRIAFIDGIQDDLRTYDFDGTDWAQVGNDLNFTTGNPALAALSANRIAFIDANEDDLRAYDFDGTDWLQVGNDLNIVANSQPAITALSSNRIAFIDEGNGDLRTYDFDGTDWLQVGNDFTFAVTNPAICALSSNRIALIDDTNDDLRTYEFDGTDWTQIGNDLNIAGIDSPALGSLNFILNG